MCIKLIASDIDGTLMNSYNELTDVTFKAIKSAMSLGIDFIPCTGRSLTAIDPNIMKIPDIKYAITSNGAAIFNLETNKQIYSDSINLSTALDVLKIASAYDICPIVFFDSQAYVSKECYDSPLNYGLLRPMIDYFKNTRHPVDNINNLLIARNKSIDKIFLMMGDQEIRKTLQTIFNKIPNIHVTSSAVNNIEILNKTATKGNALKFLCNELIITKDDIMAFGDSPNDDDMLKFAKYSFAMGNATESIKRLSQYTTLSNDEDGVAVAINKFILKR